MDILTNLIQRDSKYVLNYVRLYFLNYTRYVNGLHNIWKRRSYFLKYLRSSALLKHSRAAASVESKMATMQHKNCCVYQRRTWDEFKRVLSVAHASQPVERAENLEYRNQMSGVCWGAIYCSIESIFNHPLYRIHYSLFKVYNTYKTL